MNNRAVAVRAFFRVGLCLALAHPAGAQLASRIELDPAIECWYHDEFPLLGAEVLPEPEPRALRLYFRCAIYPDYYFVDLAARPEGGFQGVGPSAEESCPQVSYYVEVVSSDFMSARTEERTADVTASGECRRRFPTAAWWTGDDSPELLIGATRAGAPPIPPGFQAAGISGFIGVGAAEAGGGSFAAAAAVVASGGAAAGVGLLVANAESGSETTTSTAPASSPPAATTTIPSSPATTTVKPIGEDAPLACFQTLPDPPAVMVNEAIRFDASCSLADRVGAPTDAIGSYAWDLGDGRIRDGRVINATYRDPGLFVVRLTVTDTGPSIEEPLQDSLTREVRVEAPIPPSSPPPSPGPDPDPVLPPDLTVLDIDSSSLRVDCQTANCPEGQCRTTVAFTIANVGEGPAGPFTVNVRFDPRQSLSVDVPVAGGLAPGETRTLDVTSPCGGNCFDPDCQICLLVDPSNTSGETNRQNNQACTNLLG